MPTPPQPNESQDKFIGRCISYLISKEGKTKDQAAGQCYGMWRNREKVAKKAQTQIRRKKRKK